MDNYSAKEIAHQIVDTLPGEKLAAIPLEQIWTLEPLQIQKFTTLNELREFGEKDRKTKTVFFENKEQRNFEELEDCIGEFFPHRVLIPAL